MWCLKNFRVHGGRIRAGASKARVYSELSGAREHQHKWDSEVSWRLTILCKPGAWGYVVPCGTDMGLQVQCMGIAWKNEASRPSFSGELTCKVLCQDTRLMLTLSMLYCFVYQGWFPCLSGFCSSCESILMHE